MGPLYVHIYARLCPSLEYTHRGDGSSVYFPATSPAHSRCSISICSDASVHGYPYLHFCLHDSVRALSLM